MTAFVLLSVYLVRDTAARWIEQPAAVIAKGSVIGFMVATAVAILASFALAVDELERRLGEIGLNRVVVREPAERLSRAAGDERPTVAEALVRARALGDAARVISITGSAARAELDTGTTVAVYGFDPARPPIDPEFTGAFRGGEPVLLSPELPAGQRTRLRSTIGAAPGQTTPLEARVFPSPSWARLIEPAGMLLSPAGLGFPDPAFDSFTVSVIELGQSGPSVGEAVSAVRALARAEDINATVRSPEAIIGALDRVRARRDLWRGALAGTFGVGAAFVFAAMGVLEYREVRYVGALLRSFGAGPVVLFARHAIEQLLIANAGLALATWGMWSVRHAVFNTLGYAVSPAQADDLRAILLPEVAVIAVIMNAGVCLGMVPVAWLIAKPIGRVLS